MAISVTVDELWMFYGKAQVEIKILEQEIFRLKAELEASIPETPETPETPGAQPNTN